MDQQEQKKGPLIGIIIIIALLAIGAYYFFYSSSDQPGLPGGYQASDEAELNDLESMAAASADADLSAELSDIEKELQ